MTGTSRRRFLGALGTGAVGGATAGIPGHVGGQTTDDADRSPVVSMHDDYFDPVGLHVDPGTTVRFEIASGSHSATAYGDRIPLHADRFDSGVYSDGAYEHTFDVRGTYDYYCIPHRSMGMVGRIVVGEPGGPAEESPIPDGDVPHSDTIVDEGSIAYAEYDGDTGAGTKGGGRTMDGGGRMMNRDGRMMDGGPGWMMLLPVGLLTATIGAVGGTIYWATARE